MTQHEPKKLGNRRLILLALLGLFLLLGFGGWLSSRTERIQPGMTSEEVEAILGPPNGKILAIDGKATSADIRVWKDRGFVIEFDADNRVREVARPASSFFEKLRNKLGL